MNDEFVIWKHHPYTQKLIDECLRRIDLLVEQMVEQTATAPAGAMAEKAGAIKAYRDIITMELDEETHGN
jgi:hypothetical protein